jgi:hypothetical protein
MGGGPGLRAGLDVMEKIKKNCPCRESKPGRPDGEQKPATANSLYVQYATKASVSNV